MVESPANSPVSAPVSGDGGNRTRAPFPPSPALISLHNAQLERVKASLTAGHPDVYPIRARSSWTRPEARA